MKYNKVNAEHCKFWFWKLENYVLRRTTHYVLQKSWSARRIMSCKSAGAQDTLCLARAVAHDAVIASKL